MLYLVTKTIHIAAIISWMAGVLYLYRLFIYHTTHGKTSQDNHQMLILMEQRLYYYITLPAMIVSWIAGIAMISQNPALMKAGWLHSKLLFVFILTMVTTHGGKIHKKFKAQTAHYQAKSLRIINEIPTVLMLAIIIMVIFKPF